MYQVGDKARVVALGKLDYVTGSEAKDYEKTLGKTGKVIEVYDPEDDPFVVCLRFRGGQTGAYCADEIEKV